MKRVSTALLACVAVGVVPTLAACGSGGGGSSSAGQAAHRATVTITAAHGCAIDHPTLAAGGIDFSVKNLDATAVSEVELLSGDRIVGEKENLPPGFNGSFSINASAGTYTLYCPGAQVERSAVKITGKAAASDDSQAALLTQATTGYAQYVTTQVGYLLSEVKALRTTLKGTDLQAAQLAYAKARPFYEKIEPVAESFSVGKVNLDADIDGRINDVPPSQFEGFHRIELGLFKDRSLSGLAPYGAGLVANVEKLKRLTTGLTYQPTELANGAQELLDEVAGSKITGEEERYSHYDLLDMADNIEGSEQAFAQLQPALRQIDPGLTTQLTTRFNALDALMNRYRDPQQASGYVLYTTLTGSDKRRLAAAVKAVQEPLSQVASKVAG